MTFAFALRALRRHIVLILVTVVMVTGAGIALGTVLPKTYTSHTQVLLGLDLQGSTIDPQTASLYLKDRAMTYAQLVTADEIVNPVAAAAGIDPDTVRSRVVAAIVPETVVLDLSATGNTPEEAVALAQAVTDNFQIQVSTLNVRTGGPAILPAQLSSPQPAMAPDQLSGKMLGAVSALVGLVVAMLLALVVELVKSGRSAARAADGPGVTPAPLMEPRPVDTVDIDDDMPQAVNGTDRRMRPAYLSVGPQRSTAPSGSPQRRDRTREQGSDHAVGRHSGTRRPGDR